MIRLSKNKRYKLFEIVRLRDRDLWDVYERVLGVPCPMGRTHVHHVIPVASGGEDIVENLITLDPKTTSTYSTTDSGVWIKNGRKSPRSIWRARRSRHGTKKEKQV